MRVLNKAWGCRWPSGLERRTDNQVILVSNPTGATLLRNLGNSVYSTLPESFGGDTKSRWSFLSGVYARGGKRSHTGGKCVNRNVSWTPPLLQKDNFF